MNSFATLVRERIAKTPLVDHRWWPLSSGEYEALIEIAKDAELLYGAIDEAHDKGETFPLRVSVCGARLLRSLAVLKGK